MDRLARVVAALVVLLVLAVPSAARAQDSLAPSGASPHWLPKEDWVYRHWPPFDEQRLADLLALQPGELEAYLYNDHRSLDWLAAAKGIDPTTLVAPLTDWAAGFTDDRYKAVVDRTIRVLTQPHLAQHLLFHPYHGVDARAMAPGLFHLTPKRYWHLRLQGLSPRQTAAAGKVGPTHVVAGLTASFAVDRDEGVRLQVTPPEESTRMFDRRTTLLGCWMTRPLPSMDPGSPYAHEMEVHASHYDAMPTTMDERAADDRAVERFRAALPPSCWPVPMAWSWPAHGLAAP